MAYKTSNGQWLSGTEAWTRHYASWSGATGLGAKLDAFVTGAANIIETIRIPHLISTAVMGVFVASFAGTTLDTSTRIQRYVISELASDLRLHILSNRWIATTLAVLTAAGLAFATGADGKGAMKLWPLFGTANQLLAALTLLVVTLYLRHKGGWRYLVTAIPCVIMLVTTNWAMIINEKSYWKMMHHDNVSLQKQGQLLTLVGGLIFALALWMTIEAFITFIRPKKTA
jgi:carbon starvation protein